MAKIENCDVRFRYRCPKDWDALVSTQDAGVRHCLACDKDVYLCDSVAAFLRHAERGHCVAVAEFKDQGDNPESSERLPVMSVGWPERPPLENLWTLRDALRKEREDHDVPEPGED